MLSSTRNAARANLAAELPAAVLDQLLTIDINTAIAWSNYVQHDWTALPRRCVLPSLTEDHPPSGRRGRSASSR
jgi:hypothetical protein